MGITAARGARSMCCGHPGPTGSGARSAYVQTSRSRSDTTTKRCERIREGAGHFMLNGRSRFFLVARHCEVGHAVSVWRHEVQFGPNTVDLQYGLQSGIGLNGPL